MLYKVTGACHTVCVCVCVCVCGGCVCVCVCVCVCGVRGGGGQSSVVRGVREGRGGKDWREFSFLTVWWMKHNKSFQWTVDYLE